MRTDCWVHFKKFLINAKGIKQAEKLFLETKNVGPISENVFLQDLVDNGFSVARGKMFLDRVLDKDSSRLVGLLLSNRELDMLHIVGFQYINENQAFIADYEALVPWSTYWKNKLENRVRDKIIYLRYLIYW